MLRQPAGGRTLVGSSCGPYRVLAQLGAGGMGTVYLAETEAGERVALKLLHPHLMQKRGFFTRFRREAEAGRQVDHPNVVRTLDCDLLMVGGALSYFLVMEYVEGQTLRDLLAELGRVPEGLLREIALQASAGLAAIHSEGIVHRDLKPENILLAGDQRVRIMDLGVAKLEETTAAITLEGRFAGSLLYVSPEQIRQEHVGPSADLYALGVMLHELASGRNAFRRDSAAAVMYAHLHHEPPPLDNVSPYFAALVETLLEKTPMDRFGSAAALRRTLEDGEDSRWWQERKEDTSRRPGVRIPVRRATKIYGRDHERRVLRDAWERARAGAGAAVLIEGEAGIGKTRLLDAFVQSVAGEGAAVLYGSFPPSAEGDALADALLRHLDGQDLEAELSWYLEATPALLPAFAARLRRRPLPEGAVPLDRGALQTVWAHVLRGLAKDRPLVWVVEDLHFAPAEMRAVLQSMADAVTDRRALLLASVRTPLSPESSAQLTPFRKLALRRLTAGEVMRLVDDAFRNRELTERLGGRIARKSDGVPFFVCEMLRGLSERRFLGGVSDARLIDRIEVPSAVRDLIEARLAGLSAEERTLLDVASVQGFDFDPRLTARVLGLERVTVLQRIALLERRLGVVRGEEQTCTFDHHLVQEVLYRAVMPSLRREYHALVAEAFLADGPAEEGRAYQVATHHLRGARPERAFPHLLAAFDHLRREVRNEALIDLAELALGGGLRGELRIRVMLHEAAAQGVLGRTARQREVLEQAYEESAALGDRGLELRVLVELGGLEGIGLRAGMGRRRLDEALRLARAQGDRVAEARATISLGLALGRTGDLEGARARLESALAVARETGDRETEAMAAAELADGLAQLGRYEEARAHASAAVRKAESRTGEVVATLRLASAHAGLGDRYAARELAEQALVVASAVGYRRGEAIAALELASNLRALGRWPEAGERYELAVARARESGERSLEARALGEWGSHSEEVGRGARALDAYEQSLMMQREFGDRVREQRMVARRGHLLAAYGGSDTARHAVEEAADALRGLGARPFEADAVRCLGRIAELYGESAEAARRYGALLRLQEEIRARDGVADAALRLGRVEGSVSLLRRARDEASDAGLAGIGAEAELRLALAGHGDLEEARRSFAMYEMRLPLAERLGCHAALHAATGEAAHLQEARRLLLEMRDQAPPGLEEACLRRVPRHAALIA